MSKNVQEFLAQVDQARRNAEGIYEDGKWYLVLKRNSVHNDTEMCPFCGNEHFHDQVDGHRVAHCPDYEFNYIMGIDTVFTNKKGQIFKARDGYIIKTV